MLPYGPGVGVGDGDGVGEGLGVGVGVGVGEGLGEAFVTPVQLFAFANASYVAMIWFSEVIFACAARSAARSVVRLVIAA